MGGSDYNAIQGTDSWLRLNQAGQFGSGVYTPGLLRADGGFQVDGYEMVGSNADMLYANRKNTTGGGLWISDDGGLYDYNNGYIDFRGSTGIRVLEGDGSWGDNSIRATYLCMKDDCRSSWPAAGVGGSGTTNYIAKFTAGTTIGNSQIYDDGTKVVIGGGTGKLDVGTVDPIFDIDGKKYATYMADFAGGTRIETSGVLKIENWKLEIGGTRYQYTIDFDEVEAGSDLWLFWQASNKDINDIAVLLTPGFDGKVWYEKKGNAIIIQGDPEVQASLDYGAGRAGEVSYRLSAPRVDYENWKNLSADQGLAGIKITDYEK